MGLKRKASVLEDFETSFHFGEPNTFSPSTPSLPSLSPPSSTKTTRFTTEDTPTSYPYNFWKLESSPYLSSRTRKRYRDGRPDEETIHEQTLKKLYDAQRLHLDEAMHFPEEEMISLDEQHGDCVHVDADTDMVDDLPVLVELPRTAQGNQRTLDAFFGQKDARAINIQGPEQRQSQAFISRPNDGDKSIPLAHRDSRQAQYRNQHHSLDLKQPLDRPVHTECSMDLLEWRNQLAQYVDVGMGIQY